MAEGDFGLVLVNLTLAALVAVPLLAVLGSLVAGVVCRRRRPRPVRWVHIPWVGTVPVLLE